MRDDVHDNLPSVFRVEPPEHASAAFMAGTTLEKILSEVSMLRREFTEFKANVANLNSGLGQMNEKTIKPIMKELQFFRYNQGDKINQTVSQLQAIATNLDRQLDVVMKAMGMNAAQREMFRQEFGVPKDVPSLQELKESGQKAQET
jgi:hypothetical protein